jgi:hypothetical protein
MAMSASAAVSFGALALAWLMKLMLVSANKKIKQSNNEATLLYAY